jgi:hypothetical protein
VRDSIGSAAWERGGDSAAISTRAQCWPPPTCLLVAYWRARAAAKERARRQDLVGSVCGGCSVGEACLTCFSYMSTSVSEHTTQYLVRETYVLMGRIRAPVAHDREAMAKASIRMQ